MPLPGKIVPADILVTGVTAGTYGSATQAPVLTINAQGQVTSASNASVSPDLTLSVYANVTVAAGDLVYLSGWDGASGYPTIDFADADAPEKAATYVCDSAITSTSTGTVSKLLLSAATLNTNGFSAIGSSVYLSVTATTGNTWTTAPTGGDVIQQVVGKVVVKSATVGQIQFDLIDAPITKAGTTFLQTGLTITSPILTTPQIAAGGSINDTNGNELLKVVTPIVASAINEFTLSNAATGAGPTLTATGGDTNIPVTLAGKGTGVVKLGQATSVGVELVADQPIVDSSDNELIKFSKAATAVNEVTIGNAATGAGPTIAATGGDTNVPVTLAGKGTGKVALGQATSAAVQLVASQPLTDANNNELIKFVATASAVNEITVTNAATGVAGPTIQTTGEANVNLNLAPAGSGTVALPNNAAPHLTVGGGTVGAQIKMLEPSGSGSNFALIDTPALAANTTVTLPDASGTIAVTGGDLTAGASTVGAKVTGLNAEPGTLVALAANQVYQRGQADTTWVALTPIASATTSFLALAADADLAAKSIWMAPGACLVQSVKIIATGNSAGIDNSNTSVWSVTNSTQSNTIATKTFNAGTVFPSNNGTSDMGTITNAVLAANDVIQFAITNGTTAATPSGYLQINYTPLGA